MATDSCHPVLLRVEVFEVVQEDSPAVVPDGNILAPRREVHAGDVPERGARGRPVGEGRERWEVDLCEKMMVEHPAC